MPLTLHRSHHLERLAEALGACLQADPRPPLEPERIVTASLGFRRWLGHHLAEALGVAMNFEFLFPADFVAQILAALSPQRPPSPIYQREVLPWKIHAALPGLLSERDFALLKNYAGDDPLMRWHLASQIAVVFDRYLAYRPDLLLRWEQGKIGEGERWQARLWRKIADGHPHGPALLREFAQSQRPQSLADPAIDDLPLFQSRPARAVPAPKPLGRFSIFAPTTLSPFYLQVLEVVAPHADLHLYLLTPTQEYWGDVYSEREKARLRRWMTRRGANAGAHTFSAPHPLLASLGKVGREFHEAALDLSPAGERDHFATGAPKATVLGALQHSILTLDTGTGKQPIAATDRSLQIHSCHSPLREVEVLHDQLLALFEADPTLEPRDVLVTVTDMSVYAPCIEAVFDAPESDAVRFPFSIADRTSRAENPVADALLRILALVESRYPASAVLALLESAPIRTRFELAENDLTLIRDWVSRSGIRWGLDEAHRASHHLPPTREHTWKFGLDRLLLGFALPCEGPSLFHGILPDDDVEGEQAVVLGRFAAFCSTLFSAGQRLASLEVPAAEWRTVLHSLLAELCAGEGEFAEAYRFTSAQLSQMARAASDAGHTEPLPFRVVQSYIASLFAGDESGAGFLRGGITFCALKPMRALPHRIIAVLGLNGDAFPRTTRPPAFDLTAAQPLPGDRTLRDDDRYLFLEMLLSARDTLLLGYCGQSAKDNSPRPPSVLVQELLDHLAQHFTPAPPFDNIAAQLTTVHCLQAFHPRYFTGDARLFSYSQENGTAAARALGARDRAPVFPQILAPMAVEKDVPLAQFIDALVRSARFFARQRLQLALPFEQPAIEDTEPIDFDGLDRYALSKQLTEIRLGGRDTESIRDAVHAAGALPHGYAGTNAFADADTRAVIVATHIAQHAPGPILPPPAIHLTAGDWNLSGTLGLFTASAMVCHRAASIHGGHLLSAWLSHLALCATQPDGYPKRTVVVGTDDAFAFSPLSPTAATSALLPLLDLYTRAHAEPLPLFPKTSHAFAAKLSAESSEIEKALTAATTAWKGNTFTSTPGESGDQWNALIWQSHPNPLGEEFQRLAMAVFGPLLQALAGENPTATTSRKGGKK